MPSGCREAVSQGRTALWCWISSCGRHGSKSKARGTAFEAALPTKPPALRDVFNSPP